MKQTLPTIPINQLKKANFQPPLEADIDTIAILKSGHTEQILNRLKTHCLQPDRRVLAALLEDLKHLKPEE